MRIARALTPAALAAASVVVLAGCTGEPAAESTDDGRERIAVVASTNVYGQIAEQIGGEFVEVTSIVSSAAQDPHSYEPSAQDQLVISRAALVIENGGGYDAFVEALVEASGSEAAVITAVEFSHDWPGNAGHDDHTEHAEEAAAEPEGEAHDDGHDHAHDDHAHDDHGHDHAHDDHGHDEHGHDHDGHGHIEGFNEHVWYDPHTIEHVAEAVAEELGALLPEEAETFRANADAFAEEIAGLEAALAQIEATDAGAAVFVTEPVPVYLIEAAGLVNISPSAFSQAVEEGQDVPPATLLQALGLVESGDVRVVITNPQTGGAETTQVVTAAESHGIPVIEFAETLPAGQTYISWMNDNVAALAGALGR